MKVYKLTAHCKNFLMQIREKMNANLLIWMLFYCTTEARAKMERYNVTAEQTVKRDKRFITFTDFGVHKFIAGFSYPIELYDKKPWRSIGGNVNFQGQYGVPTTPLYWWDKWNGRTLQEARMQYDRDGTYAPDESRVFVYALIEYFLSHDGRNGKECLLRAICENGLVDEGDGVFGEIIRTVLTPGKDSPEEYQDAFKAGRYGTVCTTMYPKCPFGQGLLDGLMHTHETNYVGGN